MAKTSAVSETLKVFYIPLFVYKTPKGTVLFEENGSFFKIKIYPSGNEPKTLVPYPKSIHYLCIKHL
jgi:hypothetical protein